MPGETRLDDRLQQARHRAWRPVAHLEVGDATISKQGKINWALAGVYGVKIDQATGLLSAVLHRPSGMWAEVGSESGASITGDWEINNNWSDQTATLMKGAGRFKLSDFFPKAAGPNFVRQLCGNSDIFKRHVSDVVNCVRKTSG